MATPVSTEERRLFDLILEDVIDELPDALRDLMAEVPIIVEDYPSPKLLADMGMADPAELCGLHDGVALTDRSVMDLPRLPDTVTLYRMGILELSLDDAGYVDEAMLAEQIRITILHEFGHHFGLDEDDLAARGLA